MRVLTLLIWVAGAVQLVILAANFALPEKLHCRENLARVSRMIRHVFIVHWIYILAILAISFIVLVFGVAALGLRPR